MQPVKVVLNRSTPRLVGAQCSRDACCLLCPSTRQQVTVELPHAPLLASDLVQPVRLLAGQQTHGEAASCVLGGHSCLDGRRRRRRRRGGAAPRRSDCLPHCWAGVALPALEEACGIRERQRCAATLADSSNAAGVTPWPTDVTMGTQRLAMSRGPRGRISMHLQARAWPHLMPRHAVEPVNGESLIAQLAMCAFNMQGSDEGDRPNIGLW